MTRDLPYLMHSRASASQLSTWQPGGDANLTRDYCPRSIYSLWIAIGYFIGRSCHLPVIKHSSILMRSLNLNRFIHPIQSYGGPCQGHRSQTLSAQSKETDKPSILAPPIFVACESELQSGSAESTCECHIYGLEMHFEDTRGC